ncbi:enoyl-CoA hydratase/isomerase family protein [Mycobacterium sp. PSTR-4-N]|uniref:enoyl-CoA hydratase/isomerase family protein n=1 Tax=Mycobacterium sp. PSTR-4-N TaxID=2917745 RepID=UPI001F149E16|nr:enoyl-CoA hydratase-related protein [Mycobacterium sp. PSTR-4-N]MCG7595847.1 enoyl-CoA hydratase-related protein [Mycobacterium sp. PSTR-4-N]
MSDFHTIDVQRSAGLVRLTLNRPAAANGINAEMAGELAAAAAACDDPAVRVVVITGAGRFFSAGGDLKEFASAPHRGRHLKGVADDLHRAISTFARCDAVVITAVNGAAAGAGFSLAVLGDITVAAESASFTMAYTRVGLTPDGGATYLLPRLVGMARAKELMLTNRRLSAQDALQWGLVTEVVADDALTARVDDLAAGLLRTSGGANGGVKALLLDSFGNGVEAQMELEGRMIAGRAESADGREGVDAFLAKRTPDFA